MIGDAKGHVNYFKRLPDGKLTEMPDLEANGEVIDVNCMSAPLITDWNNDGLLDLVLGATTFGYWNGVIRIYLNNGTPGNPALTDYSVLFCGNDTIKHIHIQPDFTDLNLDGLKDIVISQYRRDVYYYENVGTLQEPVFNRMDSLNVLSPLTWHYSRSICSYDWDGNGSPDILIGDDGGYIYRYMNKTPVKIEGTSSSSQLLRNIRITTLSNSINVYVTLNSSLDITIGLYTINGRRIELVNRNNLEKADHCITINRRSLSPGVYLLRCTAGYEESSARILLF